MKKGLIIGTVLLMLLGLAVVGSATDIEVNGTSVTQTTIQFDVTHGWINILANGIDTSTWHPGDVGNTNNFIGNGSFTGTYSVTQGTYGGLYAHINADSKSPATFEMHDYQDFNVLSGNHIYNVEGYFDAYAGGDSNVTMNLKTAGSMYVWSEATDPWSADPLRGNYIEKYSRVDVGGVPQAELDLWVNTDGSATMSNSNIWGWGIDEGGNVFTNYGGGTRSVSATGSGTFGQTGWGTSGFSYTASYSFPGGGGFNPGLGGWFNNGLSGTYQMSGN